MCESFADFQNLLKKNVIQIKNKRLKNIINNYIFCIKSEKIDDLQDQNIIQNINASDVIIIDQITEKNTSEKFFIVSFANTLILINQSNQFILQHILSININSSICFLSNISDIISQKQIIIQNKIIKYDNIFDEEIKNFNSRFIITSSNPSIIPIINSIKLCIEGYLIKQSYADLAKEKHHEKVSNEIKKWEENEEYIILRVLGNGSSFHVQLIYHIENKKLYCIKQPYGIQSQLIEREENNYLNFNYPFLPKLYGKDKKNGYLIIQFINGKTLKNIESIELNFNEKIIIIFELIMSVKYLWKLKFILRDLKPDNVMIDQNKTAFIIDFDRMIKYDDVNMSEMTKDFSSLFAAPEINSNKISYKSDVYSLGKMIDYILIKNKTDMNKETMNIINKIIKRCTVVNINERPSVYNLLFEFYLVFSSIISNSIIRNDKTFYDFEEILILRRKYMSENSRKAIHYLKYAAHLNYPKAQYNLGKIYFYGEYLDKDINKAIHYFKKAANQNYPNAQCNLGEIYLYGKYLDQDINKAINYFEQAAKQNYSTAQNYLGKIFFEGKFVPKNINKAIQYFIQAVNQNNLNAQNYLGEIYYEGKYVNRDIDKAIHYFTLAANQDDPKAQANLGEIYYEGKYANQDIDKAIHYFTLAANQDDPKAQANLGEIYYEGKYASKDINKAIHYFYDAATRRSPKALLCLCKYYASKGDNLSFAQFALLYDEKNASNQFNLAKICFIKKWFDLALHYLKLSSDQGFLEAQKALFNLYIGGYHVKRDVNKALQYLKKAADQNDSDSLFTLGSFYYEGNYVEKDIQKGIYYLYLAANQNNPIAQNNLGYFYYNGENVKRDINLAIRYFKLAADSNFIAAQRTLGDIYYNNANINKAIHYYTLAANQNDPKSQNQLGIIFYEGNYVLRNVDKALYYLKLAVNQNYSGAQNALGVIYLNGQYIKKDINKAIHYLTLAANQNNENALTSLAIIYMKEFGKIDLVKSVYYLRLAAEHNIPVSHFLLGIHYLIGEYLPKDFSKGLYYINKASKQNLPIAQYTLGTIYFFGHCQVKKNITLAIDFFNQSSLNGYYLGHFILGYLYHEGKYLPKDIIKSVHFYKLASNFYCSYAKNNLGIIFKYGYNDDIKQNLGLAIEYFNEAIRESCDPLAIYNLAHLYIFYRDKIKEGINKSFELLVKYLNSDFHTLKEFFCIPLILKNDFNTEKIVEDLSNNLCQNNYLQLKIFQFIKMYQFDNKEKFKILYQHYESIDLVYNIDFQHVILKNLNEKTSTLTNNNNNNITREFYEGFGIEI